jgi:hypothetical protein
VCISAPYFVDWVVNGYLKEQQFVARSGVSTIGPEVYITRFAAEWYPIAREPGKPSAQNGLQTAKAQDLSADNL